MRAAGIATLLLFAAFLGLPIGSLMVLGFAQGIDARVREVKLAWRPFVEPADRYRNNFVRNWIMNSPAGMAAIRTRHAIDHDLFGFVDTPAVVSGKDGWLFDKSQMAPHHCLADAVFARMLAGTDAMRRIAEAIGIDLVFTVSPDKAVAHRDKLGRALAYRARCKLDAAARWRRLARVLAPTLIDHLEVLQPSPDGEPLYLATDTHWNEAALVQVFPQLAWRLAGQAVGRPAAASGQIARVGDAMFRLGLLRPEASPSYRAAWQREIAPSLSSMPGKTLVVLDSFYGPRYRPRPEFDPLRIVDMLKHLFPDLTVIQADQSDAIARALMPPAPLPRRILVNSVERHFFRRVAGAFSWHGGLGRGLLHLNAAASARCRYRPIAETDVEMVSLVRRGGHWEAGHDPQIFFDLPAQGRGGVCARLRYRTDGSMAQAFLPVPNTHPTAYRAGFSVDFHEQAGPERDIRFVLPAEFAGRRLRFDPIAVAGTIRDLVIEVGEVEAETAAAGNTADR